jgi:HEAT repeat protein
MNRRSFRFTLALATLIAVAGVVRADDGEPELRGRKISEWIEMLRGHAGESGRRAALFALGAAAAEPGIWRPMLIQQRRAGLLAVEIIGPGKSRLVFPAVLTALHDDPDDKVRESAAAALGRLGGRMVDDVKDANRIDPAVDRKKPLPLNEVREGLGEALRGDKSPRVREACAVALGKLEWSAKNAVPALAQALKDDNTAVRGAAVEALRRIGNDASDALAALQEIAKDEKGDRLMRTEAIHAIARLDKDSPVETGLLLKIWHDPGAPVEVRVAVADALDQLMITSAAADLGTELAIAKNDLEVRRGAAVALVHFGADARPAIPQLRAALKDDDKFVRSLSMNALGKVKEFGDERKSVLMDLCNAFKDRVLEVRVAAIETLGVLGTDAIGDELPIVVERLKEATRDGQKSIREAAQATLKKLGK